MFLKCILNASVILIVSNLHPYVIGKSTFPRLETY